MPSRTPPRPPVLGDLLALFPPLPTARRFKTVSTPVRVMPPAPPRVPRMAALSVRQPATAVPLNGLPPAPVKTPRPSQNPRKTKR